MRARKFVTYMPITMQGSSHYNVNHRDIVQNYYLSAVCTTIYFANWQPCS